MKFKVFHSSASSAAHRHPREHVRPRARPELGQDERASVKIKVPKNAAGAATKVDVSVSKDGYAKIPGTRIQKIRGGKVVRVIEEDGKTLAPDKVKAAEAWLARLVRLARKKEEAAAELAAVHSTAANLHRTDPLPAPATQEAPVAPKRPAKALVKEVQVPAGMGSKKARRAEARRQRQQSGKSAHDAQAAEGGRTMPDEDRRAGEVVQRDRGRAWVKLLPGHALPEDLRERFRVYLGAARAAATAAAHEPICPGVSGDVVAVAYRDIAEGDLKPGVRLTFRLFTEAEVVGGCDARADAEQPAKATGEDAPPAKKRKTEGKAAKDEAKEAKKAKQRPGKSQKKRKAEQKAKLATASPAAGAKAEDATAVAAPATEVKAAGAKDVEAMAPAAEAAADAEAAPATEVTAVEATAVAAPATEVKAEEAKADVAMVLAVEVTADAAPATEVSADKPASN